MNMAVGCTNDQLSAWGWITAIAAAVLLTFVIVKAVDWWFDRADRRR